MPFKQPIDYYQKMTIGGVVFQVYPMETQVLGDFLNEIKSDILKISNERLAELLLAKLKAEQTSVVRQQMVEQIMIEIKRKNKLD